MEKLTELKETENKNYYNIFVELYNVKEIGKCEMRVKSWDFMHEKHCKINDFDRHQTIPFLLLFLLLLFYFFRIFIRAVCVCFGMAHENMYGNVR